MSYFPVYGFPCVKNPNDFTPAEIEAHRLACANYGKPSFKPNEGCFSERGEDGALVRHVLRTSWGIGTNMMRSCDQCMEPSETITCHDCGRDYCTFCWPSHAKGDEA